MFKSSPQPPGFERMKQRLGEEGSEALRQQVLADRAKALREASRGGSGFAGATPAPANKKPPVPAQAAASGSIGGRVPKMLTAAAVARYQPGPQRREIPDAGSQGLRLVIQPSGARSWAMRFRRPNGESAKLTLGPVDLSGKESARDPALGAPLTLAGARRLAADIQRQRALGHDVIAAYAAEKRERRLKTAARAASTFDGAARTFVEEHARPRTRRWRETARLIGLRPDNLDIVRGGLADRWRDKSVAEIDGHDIYSVVDEVRRQGVPGLQRRNPSTSEARARAMFAALSKLLSWLVAHRRIPSSPCLGMPRPLAPLARDRVLSDMEICWFWAACDAVGEPFGPLLKLLLITGARREEGARMTRAELTDDGSTWTLAGLRTKNKRPHVLPLPRLARDIIGGVRQIAGEPGYVFSTTGRSPVSGFSKIKARLDREMLALAGREIPPWRLHDLRRTAATGMARAGADLHVIERALNHVSGSFGGIVAVYQRHKFEPEVQRALEAWANILGGIVGAERSESRRPLQTP